MRRRRPPVAALVACFATVVCTGCTASSPSGGASGSLGGRSADPVQLGCADAGSGSTPNGPDNLTIAGLTLEGLAVRIPGRSLPIGAGPGMPAGSNQRFRKTPAYLPAGTAATTVELIAPTAGQALAWVPATRWTGGGRLQLQRWMTSRVTLDGCPDRDATYFGGVLAPEPDACLHLRVQPTGAPPRDLRLRLDGAPC